MDLGIAASTAASLGRTGLLAIGLRCRVQNTPYIVALAAHASHEKASAPARASSLSCGDTTLQVLSIPRPEARVHHLLSQAVLEVTGSLLEGKTRSIIARARNRSERTVANQLSIAFRQLHASSRLDLLRVLARSQQPQPS
jgi:DNA-binding NarL/FixJ family response regulator